MYYTVFELEQWSWQDSIKYFRNCATPFVVNGFTTSLARFSVQSNRILCEESIIGDTGFIISIPFRSRIFAPHYYLVENPKWAT